MRKMSDEPRNKEKPLRSLVEHCKLLAYVALLPLTTQYTCPDTGMTWDWSLGYNYPSPSFRIEALGHGVQKFSSYNVLSRKMHEAKNTEAHYLYVSIGVTRNCTWTGCALCCWC
jgi:hypothetical protein